MVKIIVSPVYCISFFVFIIFCLLCSKNSIGQDNRLWATYFGNNKIDLNENVTTDKFGNVYMSGYTESAYGLAFGGFQNTYGGGSSDAYLVKFDAAGNRLWATYYGGSGFENGVSVATDLFGNVYLAGYTTSASKIAFGGFQNSFSGGMWGDAFLVKFSPSGIRLWATYYGGSGEDQAHSIAIDAFGNVYLAGYTGGSTSNIASGGFQNTHVFGTGGAGFLVKFNSSGNRLWATYYGGTDDTYPESLVTDPSGNIYMAGRTNCQSDIASGGFQNVYGGGLRDDFLVKFDSLGNRLWATYYGGKNGVKLTGNGIALASDRRGNVYLSGNTNDSSGIASGGFQNIYGGGISDAYLVKFDSSGNRSWATYYGGAEEENGYNIATDAYGNVFLAGDTQSPSGIAYGGYQNVLAQAGDCFLVKFDSAGARLCATYYGSIGSEDKSGHVAVDESCNVYLSGTTSNSSGIATNMGFQNYYGGGFYDSFLVKFNSYCTILPVAAINGTAAICSGQSTILNANGGCSYLWSTGSIAESISVSPTLTSPYSVIVSNACGSDTAVFTVTVNPLPTANITGTTTICAGQSITLTANGGNTYSWNTGATSSAITVSPITDASYTVTVYSAAGCSNTVTQLVSVNPLPSVSVSGDTVICSGETITLTAVGIGNFVWSTGNSTNMINVSPTSITTYSVTATNSCGTVTDAIEITVNPLPVTTLSNDTTILYGNSAQLLATRGVTYSWNPATGLSCTSCQNPIATPQTTTTYFVTITDANGCSVTEQITLTVDENFEIFVPDIFSPNNDGHNDVLYVRGTGIKELHIIVYDRLGEKIFESNDVNKGWDGTHKGSLLNEAVFVYYVSATLINDKKVKTKGDVTLVR